MALEKEMQSDKIEVIKTGNGYPVIQVRTAIIIKEDGIELSRSFHRHIISPLDDTTSESPEVQAICAAVHTAEVKTAYQAHLDSQA